MVKKKDDDDDDDETFRNVLQHKASPCTKETQTSFRMYQADPGCKSVKTTVPNVGISSPEPAG